MAFNDDVAEQFVGHWLDLMRTEPAMAEGVLVELKLLEEDLVAQIRKFDVNSVRRETFKFRRLEKMLENTRSVIEVRANKMNKTLEDDLVDLADIQQKAVVANYNQVINVPLMTTSIDPRTLRTIATTTNIVGSPAEDWWGRQSQGLRMQFEQQMRTGLLQGETNDELVRRVRGTSTGRRRTITLASGKKRVVTEFRGGMMDKQTREVQALVRTAAQSVAGQVEKSVYDDHADILRGYEALAVLDDRTTDICMARSGGAWAHSGDPLPDSPVQEPFPGPPPWHFKCRTRLIPITKSWDNLFGTKRARELGLREGVDKRTQASMNGQVAAKFNFESWLRKRVKTDPAFVREKLGPGRFSLWSRGKITTRDLINHHTGERLTLDQLRKIVEGRK